MKTDTKIATITLNPAVDQTVAIPNFSAGGVNRVKDFRCDAGDAMLSGMLAGKIENRSLRACARLAMAFALFVPVLAGFIAYSIADRPVNTGSTSAPTVFVNATNFFALHTVLF